MAIILRLTPASAIVIGLCGCEPPPVPPEKLAMPSARMMTPPAKLADVQEGASVYEAAAVCRAQYGRETGKLTGLQTYVRTIHKDRVK